MMDPWWGPSGHHGTPRGPCSLNSLYLWDFQPLSCFLVSNSFAFSLCLCSHASIRHAYFCSWCNGNCLVWHVVVPYILVAGFRSPGSGFGHPPRTCKLQWRTEYSVGSQETLCHLLGRFLPPAVRNQEIPSCLSKPFLLPQHRSHHHRRPLLDWAQQGTGNSCLFLIRGRARGGEISN